MEDLASDAVLDRAFAWLGAHRKHFPAACDVWSLRWRWPAERARLRADLLAGRYRFGLLSRVTLRSGEEVDVWGARDALVLKALSIVLADHLAISDRCCHVKGHGGSKGALRDVLAALPHHRFVLKTDVRRYYASIGHDLLLTRLEQRVGDPRLLSLLAQYLGRSSERGGLYWHFTRGISLGCPLSPIMGAFFLRELDTALERTGLFFRRYMDDIVVLTPTRWKLRHAVRVLNRQLALLELDKHPDKTYIGKVEKGFDFLGYQVAPSGLTIAEKTVRAFVERASRLYEREAGTAPPPHQRLARRALIHWPYLHWPYLTEAGVSAESGSRPRWLIVVDQTQRHLYELLRERFEFLGIVVVVDREWCTNLGSRRGLVILVE